MGIVKIIFILGFLSLSNLEQSSGAKSNNSAHMAFTQTTSENRKVREVSASLGAVPNELPTIIEQPEIHDFLAEAKQPAHFKPPEIVYGQFLPSTHPYLQVESKKHRVPLWKQSIPNQYLNIHLPPGTFVPTRSYKRKLYHFHTNAALLAHGLALAHGQRLHGLKLMKEH